MIGRWLLQTIVPRLDPWCFCVLTWPDVTISSSIYRNTRLSSLTSRIYIYNYGRNALGVLGKKEHTCLAKEHLRGTSTLHLLLLMLRFTCSLIRIHSYLVLFLHSLFSDGAVAVTACILISYIFFKKNGELVIGKV